MKIYVVIGEEGEYSDRVEWCVKAFTNKPAAEQFVIAATAHGKEMHKKYGQTGRVLDTTQVSETRIYDPHLCISHWYDPAQYRLEEIELVQP